MNMRLLNRTGLAAALVLSLSSAFAQKPAEEEARRYYLRGVAAVEMAKSEEELANAVEEFKKATQIAPTMASAWYNLGMVQSKIGRLKDAIDSFGRYVALAPQTEEAKKLRDEMVKLEYKLEQAEKFKHLAGVWILEGAPVQAVVEGSRLTLQIGQMSFPGIIERWMWSERTPGDDAVLGNITLRLEIKGNKVGGIIEILTSPDSSTSSRKDRWCQFPAGKETNQVEGTLADGAMLLKIKKIKYRFESNKGESMLFGSTIVRCDAVTPMGDVVVEKQLRGPMPPLPKGRLGIDLDARRYVTAVENAASGLLPGDQIISVDGIALAELGSDYERTLKLRGEPGTVANLVVKRVLEKAGTFTEEKSAVLNLAVQRIEIKP